MCKHECEKGSERQREREFCGKRTADLRILRTAVSWTHAEIQSQKWRGFRLNIHTAAKPPTLTQTVISRYKQAFLHVLTACTSICTQTQHTRQTYVIFVFSQMSVSTHLKSSPSERMGSVSPYEHTRYCVWLSICWANILHRYGKGTDERESERDRERERLKERQRG